MRIYIYGCTWGFIVGNCKIFGVRVKELSNANRLSKEIVFIGQKLMIPGNVQITKAEVVGAAGNNQKKSGQKVTVIHKNKSVISIY